MESSAHSPALDFPTTAGEDAVPANAAEVGDYVGRFRPFLIGLAERLVGRELRTRLAVSDVVQMTLLTAIRDLPGFRGTSQQAMRDWLVAILRHRIVDESRRLRSCMKRDFRRERPLEDLHLRVPGRGPASEVIVGEQINRLLDAIEALDPLERAIVRARYLEDESFDRIGQRLGLSHGAVRRRWLKAMQAIGRQLGKESAL